MKVQTLSTHSPFLEVVQYTPDDGQLVSLYRHAGHALPVTARVVELELELELEPEMAHPPTP